MAASMGKDMDNGNFERNTLIIRHLPSSMNNVEKQEFLEYFGAVHVRVLSNFGRMKHAAFATFRDQSAAAQALTRLHQLKVLGHTLVVEYAKSNAASQAGLAATSSIERRNGEAIDSSTDGCNLDQEHKSEKAAYGNSTIADGLKGLQQRIGISSRHGIDFPLNPVLRYRYPAPSVGILTNIVNSLASVPKLYTQVLHLMNKMNLPAPFGPVTPAPPLIRDVPPPSVVNNQTVEAMEMSSSSEESEIESDPDEKEKTKTIQSSLKRPSKTKNPHRAKRHKLQPLIPAKAPPVGGAVPPSQPARAVDVFEQSQAPIGKRIEFRLTEGMAGALDGNQMHSTTGEEIAGSGEPRTDQQPAEANPGSSSLVSGFGTFEHPTTEKEANPAKREGLEEDETEEGEEEDDGKVTEFISRRELRNRLPDHEIKRHPVFKRYEPGEPTTRLYLKNLAKTVEEKDLKYIYGRYVDWSSPIDRDMFTIQLMTQGRMKGQAFVGLPSEFAAQKALRDTNAYILQGKPIVVQFARSAKLKEKEEKDSKKKGRREII
ncbi:RNA-binding region-containing protein 3-like [Patiria miniata]|uniref:RNA-binding region-containing protein 3 n=1 Tax=Patiria miniata TaxID=46514 RepID=A0A914AND8_PATMI|nr:RNA-binding region-containing protein 3-like [Patiria miniata]